jgi:hypothetical protein
VTAEPAIGIRRLRETDYPYVIEHLDERWEGPDNDRTRFEVQLKGSMEA